MRRATATLAVILVSSSLTVGCDEARDDTSATPRASQADASPAALTEPVVLSFDVEGMFCDSCATIIQDQVAAIHGVDSVEASFQDESATVIVTRAGIAGEIIDAIEAKKYQARLRADGDE